MNYIQNMKRNFGTMGRIPGGTQNSNQAIKCKWKFR